MSSIVGLLVLILVIGSALLVPACLIYLVFRASKQNKPEQSGTGLDKSQN